jgi:hypothetical protein
MMMSVDGEIFTLGTNKTNDFLSLENPYPFMTPHSSVNE